ncbi:hypothetical protein DPEC_G00271490 [Dallia pectoralis]|uniref:Uncharacterized protein n=1 Tax=Dallia pectoralis TaxID=75939 RepID=A0ACC2FPW2_DALPE|nr:hypothetical protein DPEC_G00271490 [Dallia pectoralis]
MISSRPPPFPLDRKPRVYDRNSGPLRSCQETHLYGQKAASCRESEGTEDETSKSEGLNKHGTSTRRQQKTSNTPQGPEECNSSGPPPGMQTANHMTRHAERQATDRGAFKSGDTACVHSKKCQGGSAQEVTLTPGNAHMFPWAWHFEAAFHP